MNALAPLTLRRPAPDAALRELEAESIHIIREVAAEARNPVLLYSIGKDSSVLLHLIRKAFYPSPPRLRLLHIDTGWKFRAMIAFRDETVRRHRLDLLVHSNEAARAQGINPFDHGAYYTQAMKTEALKAALGRHGFDAAFGGARRDEEKSRAKERVFSFRSAAQRWDPKAQRPEFWRLYNGRVAPGESMRVFPLSNWTERDVWTYIAAESIPVVPLYFAAPRPVVERDGTLIMVDDGRMRLRPGEVPQRRLVRFRSLGCYPLTGAIESEARTLPELLAEMDGLGTSERGTRLIDRDESDSMERKKQEGLFLMASAEQAALVQTDRDGAPLGLLRFLTCGSVDDGKSTLIGRLLYDTSQVLADQLAALERDSRRHGTAGDGLDLALLLDGLEAEREQGITIDVAYRYFATPKRRFIVADTPGHEQYTRNMATGASGADLAVMLVDARHGVLTQTRRHAFIAGLMGIRHAVLAVNKIDLVGFDRDRFEAIAAEFAAAAAGLGLRSLQAIPLSARHGDNVTGPSRNTPWYEGPTLLGHLERIEVEQERHARPFRMPVQWVNRPGPEFRGYAGSVASGRVAPGDRVTVQPSGTTAEIRRVVSMDGDRDAAEAGDAVTLVLDRELDVSRGDVLAAAAAPVAVADLLSARLIWLQDTPAAAGQDYLVKLGTRLLPGTIARIMDVVDVESRASRPAALLAANDLGRVELRLQAPVAFEPFADSRDLGGFILIDRLTNATAGVGMIESGRREAAITWHQLDVDRAARAAIKGQRPAVLWLTGLSGAGKSTLANLVERRLHALGRHTAVLDGDNLRHGLNRDLGFSPADRAENVRRTAAVAALLADAGLIVIASLISPYRAERALAREMLPPGEFIEVFVDAPLAACRRRDPKGLYRRSDAGEISGLTGVDAPYEAPTAPALHLRTDAEPAEALAERVVAELRRRRVLE